MNKLLFNASEAADLLGIGETTVRQHWRDGDLGFIRIGRGRKVTLAELERFIASREESATA
ncbi:hypothetical protein A6411_23905 [Prescottella equi]|uniref:helix-turn-helix domain-containing protein n=1 Tax=Rhodococcus hoagii TaxID=43767 RepID=UPI0009C1A0BA|nr:helix-turn-helix domain-containing protein [Prescottella equi]OQQ23358.1 hypothetical protein A6411_23905 [Prescottella equi]